MGTPWWITPAGEFVTRWHEGQQPMWDSDRRELAMIAGSGGGKTSFGAPWLYREARLFPGGRNDGVGFRVVRAAPAGALAFGGALDSDDAADVPRGGAS